MKTTLALLAALCPIVASVDAQLTSVDPSYQPVPYITHTSADSVVSYDWGSNGSMYYQTSANFTFGGLYEKAGNGPINQVVAATPSAFSGASVVSIGNNVYFNTSDSTNQSIYKYGPVAGGGAASATLVSTTPNYGLYQNQGRLFITGAPNFGTNHIYYSGLNANGNLTSNPAVDLGVDSGSSGPLAFDPAGNLFYTPGFGDHTIYRWSATDVAAAIADPANNPLGVTGHVWLNYNSLYESVSGGTSMLLDQQGDLLLTLSNFSGPSVLAKFGIGFDGNYDGTAATLLQDTDIIGELRLHDDNLYLSSGNQIFAIVPEPSSVCLMIFCGLLLLAVTWRGRRSAGEIDGVAVTVGGRSSS